VIVTGEPVARFVSERLGYALCPPYTAMGMASPSRGIHAGVIFHSWIGRNIHITAAGTGWTRGFLQEVGAYVFGQLDCLRMTIATEHPPVVRLGLKLGGKIEGVLRDHGAPGVDATIIGVLRSEYRWFRVQEQAQLDSTLRAIPVKDSASRHEVPQSA
jgi:hypothetical protein